MENCIENELTMKVSAVSIITNIALSLLKLFAGLFAHSSAMISDAIHSASDVFSTFIVIIGVNLSNKASDAEHQYGHERLECIASIILAIILGATGLGIGLNGVNKILNYNYDYDSFQITGVFALIVSILSIAIKEWMYWYTRGAAKKINSSALMADAWHHRSDALSSIGSFIGILGARLGFSVLDPIASVIICLFIEKAAYDILRDTVSKLVDHACDPETLLCMKELIKQQDGVLSLDEIKTRLFGSKIYVDIEIAADGHQSLSSAHDIAENIHLLIEHTFPSVKHCMVHVNPRFENRQKSL
ncbi:cation diffusion facilitator family transporter [Cellulosilyticum sp. I15G10I2]|uniref:cation diffusion facilitator family transporter n=1 Tax=Cellulosilyticum sp. I15G10I2 TaxID=1892843 RepID=UPI00085BCA6D|nr:cation diffusion facilitator family transporter [Cellulosilyticum sp. I15G10I2]